MNTVSEMREPCLGDAFEPSNKLHRQPRQYVKNDIRRQWMRNCWLRERERECDIVIGFESEKVQLALREREWGGDGFEIWIEWFICISLYMRKFIVAVKFGIVATVIWLFFFFLIGHWLLPLFLFFLLNIYISWHIHCLESFLQ